MHKNVWLSRRALRLHAVILVVVPGFMALCLWQITRALGGNSLSWAYVFEWPLFACYAVYMWWRLLHEDPAGENPETAGRSRHRRDPIAGKDDIDSHDQTGGQERTWNVAATAAEDAELEAYNAYLAQLAEQDNNAG